MTEKIVSRYHSTYRAYEIGLVTRLAARGESMGFVGIAGIGKSNVVNFLRDLPQLAPQLEPDVTQLHFPTVDATQWQGQPEHLWELMLEALIQATDSLPLPPAAKSDTSPLAENDRAMKALHYRLRWVCQQQQRRVMFILDDFDRVLEQGPLTMLERLSVLRGNGNRGMLSYLVLTKRLPHVLGRAHDLENKSKFYDLFRHNIYALTPYGHDDALRMLKHLNDLAGKPLRDHQLERIFEIAGGQALLLKTVFKVWVEQGATAQNSSEIQAGHFADNADIQHECRRILINLHRHEQEVAYRVSHGRQRPEDEAVIDHLRQRGLIIKTEPLTWFSELMDQFLRNSGEEGSP
jgi:hypothetical protein